MARPTEDSVGLTLDAIERMMRVFRTERIIYLGGALAALCLLVYAAFLMIQSQSFTLEQAGLLFGAGGLFTVTGARVVYFLNRPTISSRISSAGSPAWSHAVTDDADLLDSIERIEAASRRTWPVMLLGLLGIVAGFVLLAVYIEGLRTQAAEQASRWEAETARLETTLRAAGEAVRTRQLDRAARLLGVALTQTQDLGAIPEAGEVPDIVLVQPDPTQAGTPATPETTRSNGLETSSGATGGVETKDGPASRDPVRGTSVLINNTSGRISCGPAVTTGPVRQRPVRSLAPGEEMPVARGMYVCRSERGEVPIPVGRSNDPERIVLTTASDGSLSFSSGPLN